MSEAEQLYAYSIFTRLKELIYGRIHVFITDDTIVVDITGDTFKPFHLTVERAHDKILNGEPSERVALEIARMYKKRVLRQYFKKNF